MILVDQPEIVETKVDAKEVFNPFKTLTEVPKKAEDPPGILKFICLRGHTMMEMNDGRYYCNGDKNNCRKKLGAWAAETEDKDFRRCQQCLFNSCTKCAKMQLNSFFNERVKILCPKGHSMDYKAEGRFYCNGKNNDCRMKVGAWGDKDNQSFRRCQ